MNLITILGSACLDRPFRQELFNDPVRTASTYGFYLHPGDVQTLKTIFAHQRLDKHFEAMHGGICNHPPCMIPPDCLAVLGAALLDKVLLEKLFTKPITDINLQGFTLKHHELYFLNTLVHGPKQKELREALEALRKEIANLMGTAKQLAA